MSYYVKVASLVDIGCTHTHIHRQTDRQTDRQTVRPTDGPTDGQTYIDTVHYMYVKYVYITLCHTCTDISYI